MLPLPRKTLESMLSQWHFFTCKGEQKCGQNAVRSGELQPQGAQAQVEWKLVTEFLISLAVHVILWLLDADGEANGLWSLSN
jgi:hypothetical protein